MKKRDPAEPRLVPVAHVARAAEFLWQLLQERPPEANISHEKMPDWTEHLSFVERYPYRCWYLIRHGDDLVGSIYLTRKFEIGIAIAKEHQRKGYGKWAVRELAAKWARHVTGRPGVSRKAFLANIAPANAASQRFFEELGFRHVQNVYALDVE